jgi:Cys-rich protein (TIGR01571 family)
MALFFPQILMAQVLTRLKMNWWADVAADHEWKRTYPVVLIGFVVFHVLSWFLTASWEVDENGDWVQVRSRAAPLKAMLNNLVTLAFGIYTLIALTKLRREIRSRYEIPVTYQALGNHEDCCVSMWCGCCAVAQMARQTCDYKLHDAAFCSPDTCTNSWLEPLSWKQHPSILTV